MNENLYINFNTEKRKNTTNSFEKNCFKLMINSVCGKTKEHLRKRINVKLVNNEKVYLKHVSKPTYVSRRSFVNITLLFMKLNQF